MLPFLLDTTIFGIHLKVPSYGVMLALSFTLAYFLSLWRAKKLGEKESHVENLFLCVIVASVVGSRGFHVLFEEPSYYFSHPDKILAVWEGGYTFYGALLASVAAIFTYCHLHKISFLPFADIAAPATALGLFTGRIGCFLAGCCWGKRCDFPWAVTFNHPETFSDVKGIALHPTQLYEAFLGLMIFLFLSWRFQHRRYEGQIFFEGIIVYGIGRFLIEYGRGDDVRGYLMGGLLSYSQFISLLLVPAALVGIFFFRRRST